MENPEGTSTAPSSTRDGWSRGRRGVFAALLASHVGHARVQRALHVGHRGDDLVPVLEDVAEEVRCVVVPGGTAPAGRGPVAIATPEALPFEDESFDLVALFDVIDTVGDDKRALTEARRVLRPGGLLVVCAPAHRWMPTLWLAWRGRRARNYSRRALRLLFARAAVAGLAARDLGTRVPPGALDLDALRLAARQFVVRDRASRAPGLEQRPSPSALEARGHLAPRRLNVHLSRAVDAGGGPDPAMRDQPACDVSFDVTFAAGVGRGAFQLHPLPRSIHTTVRATISRSSRKDIDDR